MSSNRLKRTILGSTLFSRTIASETKELEAYKEYKNDTPSYVKAVPEFAAMGGVLISYPGTVSSSSPQSTPSGPRSFGIPNELIIRMQQNDTSEPVHIFVMCADEKEKQNIVNSLTKTADELELTFNPEHLHIVPWDTDTFWTRDYGPWWIKNTKTGYFGIAKHTYTTLGGGNVGLVEGAEGVDPREGLGIFRPNDDYGAVKFSDFLNNPIRQWNKARYHTTELDKKGSAQLPPIPVHNFYYLGLLDVGGNYMVDGNGSVASTYLVATQNELPVKEQQDLEREHTTQQEIDKRMEYVLEQQNRFMGINSYRVLQDPTGTYIGHIDCWGKFLSGNKVLIARSEDPTINEKLDAISEQFEKWGYSAYRVMCQKVHTPNSDDPTNTAAYTNSLILNNSVYVPLSGQGYEEFDRDALDTYKQALPDYNIVGIHSKPEFPWLGTDAMHCRTRAVPREVINNWLESLKPQHPTKTK
ncbi:agmatine deiminase family protein [Vibrio nigripulchritudo]|uniref:agmatine deiminase family protein n=1 Tax=Vibrio nigripulchritudo TaxID=28173 RepID=UPI0003B23E19|nr:agmatine deiminase family protein [Vibrio nigripulchritudo]CCN72240.1 hypothetical protein VIBNISFn118_530025 [Vibrio nigripulchritudo SFn118]